MNSYTKATSKISTLRNSRAWIWLALLVALFAIQIDAAKADIGSCSAASSLQFPLKDSGRTLTQDFAPYLGSYGGNFYNGFHSGEDWAFGSRLRASLSILSDRGA